jgi:hypothetical protein
MSGPRTLLRRHAIAGLIAAAAATSAAAGEAVRSDTRIKQDRTERERAAIETVLQIGVTASFAVDTAVTALALAVATASDQSYDSRVDEPSTTDATIVEALRGNSGLVAFNQQAGVLNDQGNVVALGEARIGPAAATAQAGVEQSQTNASLHEDAGDGAPADWSAVATEALTGEAGVTTVNQAAGVANNQHIAIATAAAVDRPSVVSETLLLQTIATGFIESNGGRRRALAADVLNGNDGLSVFNQAAGFGNNQAAAFGLPFFVPLGVVTAIGPSGIIQR